MYDPQGDYQNGYNHGNNGGGWRNDMNSSETSGYNAAKQQEEARCFQQMQQQQEAQRRQQDDLRRTQQAMEQQAAQQRQQQAAQQQSYYSSTRSSYAGSTYVGNGCISPGLGVARKGLRSTSSVPFTPANGKGLGWLFLLSALAFTIYFAGSAISPYLHGRKMDIAGSALFSATPVVSDDGTYTFSASEVMKFRWLHDKDHPMHLNGRTVIVTGDVSNAYIHVNGNVTFKGNLRNVSVVDNDWTILASNAENSHLTAGKIVVTGEAVRTTETLTGVPAETKQKRKRR